MVLLPIVFKIKIADIFLNLLLFFYEMWYNTFMIDDKLKFFIINYKLIWF